MLQSILCYRKLPIFRGITIRTRSVFKLLCKGGISCNESRKTKWQEGWRSHFVLYKTWRCITISKHGYQINDEIRVKEIRLTDADGESYLTTTKEAIEKATEADLDLVMIAEKANPPVCRIMDYGKFLFDQAKREKEARKNQKVVNLKEIKLSPVIDEHDVSYKRKNAQKFLQDGDKVKVSIKFRGREMHYTAAGEKILLKFAESLEEFGAIDRRPKLEGRQMIMFITPK